MIPRTIPAMAPPLSPLGFELRDASLSWPEEPEVVGLAIIEGEVAGLEVFGGGDTGIEVDGGVAGGGVLEVVLVGKGVVEGVMTEVAAGGKNVVTWVIVCTGPIVRIG